VVQGKRERIKTRMLGFGSSGDEAVKAVALQEAANALEAESKREQQRLLDEVSAGGVKGDNDVTSISSFKEEAMEVEKEVALPARARRARARRPRRPIRRPRRRATRVRGRMLQPVARR
jgi:hypothetical protein